MILVGFWSLAPGAGVVGGLLVTRIDMTNLDSGVESILVQNSYRKDFIPVPAGRGLSPQCGEGLSK